MSGKNYFYGGIILAIIGVLLFTFVETGLFIKRRKIAKEYE